MKWGQTSVLVTGGAGFLGSHLVDKLVELGSNVTVVDDLSFGRRKNVNKQARFVRLDITKFALLEKAIARARPGIIYHLAANATTKETAMGWSDPASDYRVNAVGTLNVLRAVADLGLNPQIIYASSAAVYGEPEYVPIDEKHPTNPQSPYGVSKLTGEKYMLIYHKERALPVTVLRIFNVYGPRQPRYVILDLLKKLERNPNDLEVIGTGEQIRTYCYVSDAIEAFVLAAQEQSVGEVLNLAGNDITSIKELAERIVAMLGLTGKTKIHYTGQSWKGDILD
ncbi:MAG: SDR family NAD(P)-dependent oxidoreductase [Candidatus Bathyarchaeia archaeon]